MNVSYACNMMRRGRKMSDSVFIDAFTRYGWVEEYINLDEVAYVDFEKCQICLKSHDHEFHGRSRQVWVRCMVSKGLC